MDGELHMYQSKTRTEDRLSFEKDRRQSEDSVFWDPQPTLSLPTWAMMLARSWGPVSPSDFHWMCYDLASIARSFAQYISIQYISTGY